MNKSLSDIVLSFILNMSKTRANYWGEFFIDVPLGFVLIFVSLRHHDLSLLVVFLTVVLGVFLFSFFEYFIHRWLFHGSVRIMAEGHHAHHLNPMGYDSLPFFLPAMVLVILTGIFVLLMPMSSAFLLTGTITFGYSHLRTESLFHSPHPFSSSLGQTLVSSSSHSSPSHRHKFWRYHARVGRVVGYEVRI